MDDYEKARAVVLDKNNSFAELSKWSGMSIPRLKQFRADPEKLKTAKWMAVHKLANMYREVNVDMNFDMKISSKCVIISIQKVAGRKFCQTVK